MSALIAAIAFSWSAVSSNGNVASNSSCSGASGGNAMPGRARPAGAAEELVAREQRRPQRGDLEAVRQTSRRDGETFLRAEARLVEQRPHAVRLALGVAEEADVVVRRDERRDGVLERDEIAR